ncbi:hypothetical protein CVT24_012609 [Panaeolus cyanescens]|uniref:Flavin-nucleotide-binding protein n=1 Tax=Panaeolus cyanescens TaxID=181874 RepID=A0A409WD21_9AGAR|nr:hypothetical protein CVT24_012609 [Panaeolus cyanescens]
MENDTEYQRTTRNSVNRLKNRAKYDYETVHSIIDAAPVVHVSFLPTSIEDDPFPTILPMLGCTGTYPSNDNSDVSIYLHGHAASRFFKLSAQNEDEGPYGLVRGPNGSIPVCVAATLIDGIVLAVTPFNHSNNYRSVVVHGYASIVSDPGEKMWALDRITNNVLTDRWDNSRVPPTEAEMKATGVIRVEIVSASAKVRAGTNGDDRADVVWNAARPEGEKIWTGVVPMWTRYGTPVPGPENEMKGVPEHIEKFVQEKNKEGERYASSAAALLPPKK